MDAVQHGQFAGRDAVGDQAGQPARHLGGLVGLGGGLAEPRLGTVTALRHQPDALGRPLRVQHPVGHRDHLRRRAVVADQADDGGVRMPHREPGQVAGAGAGEGVNGLCRVADHAQVGPLPQPQLEQLLLQRADVLVLVDHQMPVGAPHLGADVVVVGQQRHRAEQDVVEVDHPAVALHLLVAGVDAAHPGGVHPGHLAALRGGEFGVVGGRHVADLRPADLGEQVAQRARFGAVAEQPSGRLGHHAGALVADPRQLVPHRRRPEVLRLPQRGGVEGAGLHPREAQAAQPPAQLARGPGGEGDREHGDRVVATRRAAVGDPVGDRPGLAGSGARDHRDRHAEGGRHRPLLGVEGGQQGVGIGHPDTVGRAADTG